MKLFTPKDDILRQPPCTVKGASEPAKSEEKLDTTQSGDQTIKVPSAKIENEWSPLKIEPVNSITKVPEQKSPIKSGTEQLEIITKIKIFNPHEGKRSKLEVPPTPAAKQPEKVSRDEGGTSFDENVGNFENFETVENFENVENVGNFENLENVENFENLKNVENIENTIPSPVKQLVEHYEKIEFNEISEIETSHSYFSPKQFFGYDNEDTHLISFDETPELINEGAQGSCVSKLNQTYDTHHEKKICEKNLNNVKRKLSHVQSADPIVI